MKKIKLISIFLTLSFIICSISPVTITISADQYVSEEEITASESDETMTESSEVIEYGNKAGNSSQNAASIQATPLPAYILDGVYAIKNVAYPTKYVRLQNNTFPTSGIVLQQSTSSTSPAASFDRPYLFKISRVGNTSRYVIRSMESNNLGLSFSGNQIVTKQIPSDDASVPAADTFFIEASTSGYKIRQYNHTKIAAISSNLSSDLTLVAQTSTATSSQWQFEQYTGDHRSGMTRYFPSAWRSTGMIQGEATSTSIIGWSTYINANTMYATPASGDEPLADISWNDVTREASVMPNNVGKLDIVAGIKYPSGSTVLSSSANYNIVPKTGTYYIQNTGTEKCIDIEGPSQASGAILQQWQMHSGNQEKWIVEYVPNSNGYIRFKSVYSNQYLGIDSSNTTVVRQYSNQDDYTLWQLERSSSGNLILKCKATESNGIVLSVPLNANSNGTNLTQIAYTDDTNYRDEWKIRNLTIIDSVPTNLRSNSYHLCIPCAITNIASFWCNKGYSSFGCSDAASQETAANNVQCTMTSPTGNRYIQEGFDTFIHSNGTTTYGLLSDNHWSGDFTVSDILYEIDNGMPLMLGFAGTDDSPYGGAHMTVCVGYEIKENDIYVFLSDAHRETYSLYPLNINTYNDFISIVRITEIN